MTNPITMIKEGIASCWATRTKYPAPFFKSFIAAVLVQFSLLSFLSVVMPDKFEALNIGRNIFLDPHYWWGVAGLFGAIVLSFEHCLRHWKEGVLIGYVAAITSFMYLSFDYLTRKPPIYAGSILSVTAALFLGGLLYGKFRAGD